MSYFDAEKKIKRTVSSIDDLNFARTVILARLIADQNYAREQGNVNEEQRLKLDIRNIKRSDRNWKVQSQQFLLDVDLDRGQVFGVDAFQIVANFIPNYRITVYTSVPPAKVYSVYWKGNEGANKALNIAVFAGVFDTFEPNRPTIGKHVCPFCHTPYMRRDRHKCELMCDQCRRPGCEGSLIQPLECPDCHVIFYRQNCFDSHKMSVDRQRPVCDVFKRCPLSDCRKFYKPDNLVDGIHVCGQTKWCSTCSKHVSPNRHNCCWTPPTIAQKVKKIEKQEKFKIIVYDLETVLLEDSENVDNYCEQWPNYIGYSMFCEHCIGTPIDSVCGNCGPYRTGHFKYERKDEPRDTVVRKFLHFLLYDRSLDNAIAIAHNGSRFDLHFLINIMLEWKIKPDILKSGLKLIQMKLTRSADANFNNMVFKDSFLFVPVALSAMPKAFGFPDMSKGTFPYLYNHPDRYGTISECLPPIKFYNPTDMKEKVNCEFMNWYEANKNNRFDFDKEIHEYCMNDIAVLHQGLARYIKSGIELTTFNPIVHASTFASFSFFNLKYEYMLKNQVGIIPEHGYHSNDVQSKLAVKYFKWVEKTENVDLQYSLKGGEKVVELQGRRVKFDAFHAPSNTVIEVLGCWIHGCTVHTTRDTKHPYYDETMGEVHHETIQRLNLIINAGYNLKYKWEHDIETGLKSNREMRKFFAWNQHYKRLRVRDSFCGGRTQNYNMYVKADPERNVTLMHRDVVSMYPYLLCNNPMPLGQPEVLTTNIAPITLPLPYNGFYLVDILHPRDLLHPVIPFKHNSRLLFGLCRECIYANQETECTHDDPEDRYIHVTVYQAELELALRHNYVVLRTYEVYHWDETKWSKDFFSGFLKKFIKVKTEASGWPQENMTQDEKDRFVQEFYEHEGILVEPSKMIKNSEARSIAKIMISSVWGKMAERDDKSEVTFHDNFGDTIPRIMDDDTLEVTDYKVFGDTVMISSQKKEDYRTVRPFTNVAYASIVCSLDRVELYRMLERLGPLACYSDTDSGIYIIKNGEDKLADLAGEFLGKWSSEAPEGYEIIEFVSPGPKVYSYKLRNISTGEVKEIVKSRGITLTDGNSKLVNFEAVKKMVTEYMNGEENPIITEKAEIVKKMGQVYTVKRRKTLRTVMKKVRVLDNYATRPYGFKTCT